MVRIYGNFEYFRRGLRLKSDFRQGRREKKYTCQEENVVTRLE